MSLAGIDLIAAGAVVTLLVLVEVLARVVHGSFFDTVILGQDGRTSTSKTFVFLWTLLAGWALLALLIGGELIPLHRCVTVANAATACKDDKVGLFQVGWKHFLNAGLSGRYFILLGVPAAAAVAAKAITQSQVTGTGSRKQRPANLRNRFARITEIFSADDDTTDIGDFQYLIFNWLQPPTSLPSSSLLMPAGCLLSGHAPRADHHVRRILRRQEGGHQQPADGYGRVPVAAPR